MSEFELKSARWLAADYQKRVIECGDAVIDATMGNGHDTCYLAGLVGPSGKIYAFDVQQKALDSTRKTLQDAGLDGICTLILDGHQNMDLYVQEPVKAVVFNLGWLPGGDKAVTTLWETTRVAVEKALKLLMPLGICTICVYPGHEAGDYERKQLTEYLCTLRPQEFNVLHHRFINAGLGAPECYLIQKMR